jgi:hypothetical protein
MQFRLTADQRLSQDDYRDIFNSERDSDKKYVGVTSSKDALSTEPPIHDDSVETGLVRVGLER